MRGIRIGSAFGIPIRLDLTFLIVLPLFAWLIGSDVANLTLVINELFGTSIDGAAISDGSLQWILGGAAAIGLFAGVLLHEFGHSLVAMRYGYEIESITLWLFGGVARFKEIPEDWKQEFTIAVAGPIVSVAIGLVSYAGFLLLPESQAPAQFVLGYLALVNITLAAFNMLPGFPMDGGRVLRAILARSRPHAKATQMAAEVGKVFAFLLGIFGLFFNLFLVALAFFIYIGASGEAQQTVLLGILFGPLVLVVSYLFTAATGPSVPTWADAAGVAIRFYGTALAVIVGPVALHLDRISLAKRSNWIPSPLYYLIAIPFLSIPISFIYLVRRLTSA